MLLDDKRKTIELFAENFLQGNLDFRKSSKTYEHGALLQLANNVRDDLIKWVADEQIDKDNKEHRKHTIELFFTLLGHRTRGDITGKIVDKDLDAELAKEKIKNAKLKDEKSKLKLQVEKFKKDNIVLARELKDKTDLLEQYEKTAGVRK